VLANTLGLNRRSCKPTEGEEDKCELRHHGKLPEGFIPPLVRRGGCAIKKMSRSHRSGADGVVAYEKCFRERPPRPLTSKVASQHLLEFASTPPHEEGNNASDLRFLSLNTSGSSCPCYP
jgi:hypothetical protein